MISLLLGAACALAQTPDWRILRDHTPAAALVDQLSQLAAESGETPAQRRGVQRRLLVGVTALLERPGDVVRQYTTRLSTAERAALSTRAPQITRRLLEREPYLAAAVRRARLEDASPAVKVPWRQRLRDRVVTAWARLSGRELLVPNRAAAAALAPAVLKLERVIHGAVWTAAARTPDEDVIELLSAFGELDWPVARVPDPDLRLTDAFTRYVVARCLAIEDLPAFARAYRARFSATERKSLAAALPLLRALVTRVEAPGVVAAIKAKGARPGDAEAEFARNLKHLGFVALARAGARWLGPKLEADLAAIRRDERRAERWLRFEQVLRGDERAEFVRACERVLGAVSARGEVAS